MRGPKPTPAKIVQLRGNPGRRPVKASADGVGKIGPAPDDMTDAARLKWTDAVARWGHVLTGSDSDGLRIYCEAWADMLNAQRRVHEDGAMILTPNGMVQKSPWLTKLEQSREFCRRMQAEFGGSPSSRTRVSAKEPDAKEDPAAAYFG